MKFLRTLAAWLIVGAAFGALQGALASLVACSPRFAWKSTLIAFWATVDAIEFAIVGAAVGALVYFVFRQTVPRILGFRGGLVVGGSVGTLALGLLFIGWLVSQPQSNCALP